MVFLGEILFGLIPPNQVFIGVARHILLGDITGPWVEEVGPIGALYPGN